MSLQLIDLGFIVPFGLIIICACGCFCCILVLGSRNRHAQQNAQRHSRFFSFTNPAYLQYSQSSQDDLELTTKQMQLFDNSKHRKIMPEGLPTYDDVIFGKLYENIKPPPPYSEAAKGYLEPTSYPDDSIRYI